RSLVDRVRIAVRGAAHALERVCGASVADDPGYRAALLEASVYLNAALTAFDVRREGKGPGGPGARGGYGVFDLVAPRVRAGPGAPPPAGPPFGDVPGGPEGFTDLGTRLAQAVVAKGVVR